MEALLINIVLAALPGGIILLLLKRLSPLALPVKKTGLLLLIGGLCVIPAALIEAAMLLGIHAVFPAESLISILLRAFLVAGMVEEGTKTIIVQVASSRSGEKPVEEEKGDNRSAETGETAETMHPLVIGITAAVGFGFGENILYVFGPPSHMVLRGLTAVCLHAVTGGMIGFFFRQRQAFRGFLFALLFHGFYDFFLFNPGILPFTVVPLLSIGIWFLIRMVKTAGEEG